MRLPLRGCLTFRALEGHAEGPIVLPLPATLAVLSLRPRATDSYMEHPEIREPQMWSWLVPHSHIFGANPAPKSETFCGWGLIKTRYKTAVLLLSINNANKLVKTIPKFTLTPGLQAKLLISTSHFLTMGQT